MRRTPALLLLLVLGLVVAACDRMELLAPPDSAGDAGRPREGRVVRVVDGDTVKVDLGGRRETVRYIGIDTPESVKPDAPVKCGGPEASKANARLVQGRRVRLVPGREARDRFGRTLAYVYLVDGGTFVNEALLRAGHAEPLPIRPNTAFAPRFEAVAAEARRKGLGVWACGRD